MKAITIISFTLQLGFALHYFGKFFREFFDGKVRSWLPQYDRLTSVALVIFLGLHIFSFEYLKGDIIISLTLLIFTIVLILFTKKRKNKDCQQAHIFKIEEINHKGRVNTFIYDKQGNEVYSKNSNGEEEWYEYDKQNRLIHSKNSDGDEILYKITYYEDL